MRAIAGMARSYTGRMLAAFVGADSVLDARHRAPFVLTAPTL